MILSLLKHHKLSRNFTKPFEISLVTSRNCAKILGIETSCDDTGCAIINEKGDILGETLNSQNLIHLRYGGIIPDVAQDLHRKKEKEHSIEADKLIPEANDLCAALLMTTSRHLVHRTQRAMDFCHKNHLLPDEKKQLVVSGGVACNNYIFNTLTELCNEFDYKIYRPEPKLCTDNGVMIAWNGLEKWQRNIDVVSKNINSLDIKAVSPLGESLISSVVKARIPTKLIKIKVKL
ncbi:probable tRNA N6-adenosine threonylcarbamoyltransferase, mitochondrial isoform X2 [Pararge aegeria]|uniref:probable tRNA N6-adenosine threonylcarbamoyltransferase, mitochondrial isoform X2 n=1 Tax=Pararge aegeria TaxID=116150 RepID=UPI0019D0A961|nr:probable tRNA N6-adenosine threonylcarbamoyltransferase, mitochondrial isoform X2 [Pararge aegeria]